MSNTVGFKTTIRKTPVVVRGGWMLRVEVNVHRLNATKGWRVISRRKFATEVQRGKPFTWKPQVSQTWQPGQTWKAA
jgi:hypothetical protein